MSDPRRTDLNDRVDPNVSSDARSEAERDAKIETLLLSGLDHYFASDYAQAIDIWTRALFLDRGHTRARAYIDRARSALAEQQRESDELLHNGIAAFERGEIEAAKHLLNAAVERGGAHDVALAFLTRIDRINAAAVDAELPRASSQAAARAQAPAEQSATRWRAALFGCVAVVIIGYALASWEDARNLFPILGPATGIERVQIPAAQEPLVVPTSGETAMERARQLFASGKPYDALRAADLVRPTDPLRPDAERLKAVIQRELLAFGDRQPR
jgi:hypothetical protein